MACKCIELCNKELAKQGCNTRIDIPFIINFKTGKTGPPRCKIATCKADSKKRGPIRTLLAAFCPICGKAYEPMKKKAKAEKGV